MHGCQVNREGQSVRKRCPWCGSHADYQHYHDQVWGRPVRDSKQLFAKLILDGQQAGLSWLTILRKQHHYESAFMGLDPVQLAHIQGQERIRFMEKQLNNPGIIRNKRKVASIFQNADSYVALEQEGTTFSEFIWSFVNGQPVINDWRFFEEVPTETAASRAMSKALKRAGFTFVGPTICYAYMQAVGLVNDHLVDCDFR